MNLIHSSKIEAIKTNSKDEFIKECEKIMNSSNIYDRNMSKEEFKKLYNKIKHDFPLNNNFLSNIIINWKKILLGLLNIQSLKINLIIMTALYPGNLDLSWLIMGKIIIRI